MSTDKLVRVLVSRLEGPMLLRYDTLAKELGVSRRTIQRWVGQETRPSNEMRVRLERLHEVQC